MQKLGLHQLGSNKDREAPGVFELRDFNAGQRVHRDGRAEKPNGDNEVAQSSAPAGSRYHP